MKRLLTFITALFLLVSLNGQILRYSNYTAPTPPTVLVESISVWGTGGATTISTNGGTLQMLKKTLPTNAADTSATWSRTNGTGTANISAGGLLTALTNGTVTARATANDGSAIYGEEEITISNQAAPNMVSNGDFADNATDWSVTAGFAISDNKATFDDSQSAELLQALGDMVTPLAYNTGYTITFDITFVTATNINLSIRDHVTDENWTGTVNITVEGGQSINFTTHNTYGDPATLGFKIVASSSSDGSFSVDNVKIVAQ